MTAQERRALTDAWHAQLAAAFALRRCECGAPAVVVAPGEDEQRAGPTAVLTRAAVADRCRCLGHALPWVKG